MEVEEIQVRDDDNLTSCNLIASCRRSCERLNDRWKLLIFRLCHGAVAVSSFFPFLVVATCAYLFFLPGYRHPPPEIETRSPEVPRSNATARNCSLFEGKWVRDQDYPLYNASRCPFAERGFNCLGNGRRDGAYARFRWKPRDCDVPRFNAGKILEYLRGKRVVFVGDSLSRTQWESMVCMLMTGVKDVRTVRQVRGDKITKKLRFMAISFSSYDLKIDFYRSVFLVRPGPVPRRAPKRVKWTLRLDQMDDISKEWVDADVLVFNTGHWWNPNKLFEMSVSRSSSECQLLRLWKRHYGPGHLGLMPTSTGTRLACFFVRSKLLIGEGRGGSSSCKVTPNPLRKIRGGKEDRSFISDAVLKVVENMTSPVIPLHVTRMGAYRSDAHVGQWGDDPSVPDCSHWCLPGVPDAWNEILFSLLPWNGG